MESETHPLTDKVASLITRLRRAGDTLDADLVRHLAEMSGIHIPESAEPARDRNRKPQDPERWPKSLTHEDIETKIDARCGCMGIFDCDCKHVFEEVRAAAWDTHRRHFPDDAPEEPKASGYGSSGFW